VIVRAREVADAAEAGARLAPAGLVAVPAPLLQPVRRPGQAEHAGDVAARRVPDRRDALLVDAEPGRVGAQPADGALRVAELAGEGLVGVLTVINGDSDEATGGQRELERPGAPPPPAEPGAAGDEDNRRARLLRPCRPGHVELQR